MFVKHRETPFVEGIAESGNDVDLCAEECFHHCLPALHEGGGVAGVFGEVFEEAVSESVAEVEEGCGVYSDGFFEAEGGGWGGEEVWLLGLLCEVLICGGDGGVYVGGGGELGGCYGVGFGYGCGGGVKGGGGGGGGAASHVG